ncbi:MAG: hypothetical protein DWG79_01170 [Chloroflexi bacterium]|nr:hypothetical protein [Chloroflexota bacterium]
MALRGEDGSPEGHWHSRTDAMSEYLKESGTRAAFTRKRALMVLAIFAVELSVVGLVAYYVMHKPDR